MFHQPRRALWHNASTRHCHVSVGRGALPLQTSGKRCWPHLRVCCLPRGGSGDHCRYPTDRVQPFTSFKSRQRGGRATTCHHVSRSTEICLPAEVGSEATTCPAAPEPASLVQRAPAPPRVSWLWNLPPYREGSRLPCVLWSPVAH
jgi:hypothetical protein